MLDSRRDRRYRRWAHRSIGLAKSHDAKHIADTKSAHNIEVYQPQLVADAIRELVDKVRGAWSAE